MRNSIRRKGSGAFVRGRALRLGVPFVVAAFLIAPLAYAASYMQATAQPSVAGFWQQWTVLGIWPAGPAWFVWVLLAFECIAATLLTLFPRSARLLPGFWLRVSNSSLAFCAALAVISLAVMVPAIRRVISWSSLQVAIASRPRAEVLGQRSARATPC